MRCPNCGFDSTDFQTVLSLVTTRLQQRGRISYRALQYEFRCDDALLAALREELIFTEQIASDEDGKVLVWTGKGINGETDKWRNGQDSLNRTTEHSYTLSQLVSFLRPAINRRATDNAP